jgi:uncharacterized protein YecT (DUF1311 family)
MHLPQIAFSIGAALLIATSLQTVAEDELTLPQAKAKFATTDKALNDVYQKAKKELPEWAFEELQQDQREWIEYRDSRSLQAAAFDGRAEEGKEKDHPEYWATLASVTQSRIEIVRGWMKWDSFTHDWEGVWVDGHGGWLAIMEKEPGKFLFACDVVRGPTYHLGEIDGAAAWNGNSARFSTRSDPTEPETWLTFLKRGFKLEIIGENTSYFHGARAYFDGHYVRIAELTAEDRKRILTPVNP